MKSYVLTLFLAVGLCLGLLLTGLQGTVYGVPDITGGMTYHPPGVDALIWVPQKVLRHYAGTLDASEILQSGLSSIDSVQGIVYSSSGRTALFWTPSQVFLHNQGMATVTPVLFQGVDIEEVRGILYHPSKNEALIWTPSRVLSYSISSDMVSEVLEGSISIVDVRGIVNEPWGTEVLIWSGDQVLQLLSGSLVAQQVEVGGLAITNVQNIVYAPFGSQALIWRDGFSQSDILLYNRGVLDADPLLFGASPITGVRGIATNPAEIGFSTYILTVERVLYYNGFSVSEVLDGSASISDVQGIVFHPLGWVALIWNSGKVYSASGGVIFHEVQNGGSPITNTQGIVFVLGQDFESLALIWMSGKVIRYLNFNPDAEEVLHGGVSITNTQGIVYHPDITTALLWTPDKVLRYLHPGLTTQEVLEQTGNLSISNTQAIVYHTEGTEALIWTPSEIFRHLENTFDAEEILENGTNPIVTFDPLIVKEVQVLVMHYLPDTSGPTLPDSNQGGRGRGSDPSAGIVGTPVLTPNWYCGSPSGAIHDPFLSPSSAKSTIVGAGHHRMSFVIGPDPIPGFVAGTSAVLYATVLTGTEEEDLNLSIGGYHLLQSVPNPFSGSTVIQFFLPKATPFELKIQDITGRVIRSFVGNGTGGYQKVVWNGRDQNGLPVSSGIYFYRLVSGEPTTTRKMTLLR